MRVPTVGYDPERVPETSAEDWEAGLQGLAGRTTSQSVVTGPRQVWLAFIGDSCTLDL